MGEPGRGPGLAQEPGGELVVVAEPGVHDLDRDHAVEPEVDGLVDAGHPAAGDARADPVAAVEEPPGQGVAGAGVRARLGVPILLHDDPPATGRGRIRWPHRTDDVAGTGPAPRTGVAGGGCECQSCPMADEPSRRCRPRLGALVREWIDWAEAGRRLGVTPAKVRTMIRDHELAAAVPAPGAGQQVPADFLQDGLVVKGLPGC